MPRRCCCCYALQLRCNDLCLDLRLQCDCNDRYNIDSGCCDILKGCCFPCALFQHYAFLSELQARGQANALGSTLLTADGSAGVVVAQPTSSKANDMTTLVVTLPDGVVAGQSIQVRKPDGGSVSATILRFEISQPSHQLLSRKHR